MTRCRCIRTRDCRHRDDGSRAGPAICNAIVRQPSASSVIWRGTTFPRAADHPLRSGNAISDMLLSAAMDISADLIVAGAYHHSPLRQAVIGGVSRELLQHMTVPVLMSH